ncbi:S9 family peptidase [Nonomuraea pusilla]|uniref:Dipeptidyl aminopeptidase/acylaminoacyl peptidase n=1 Tax=Nonomuraea pusilla TaxID=46177 RepID=A0A1H7Y9J6_9ACTN|nr:prolyl oligopeptidase family serine peptidase [Nonomuraea pusilla]SEM42625.1 Dipeptidyl aminopeptidase/acylaminoacyl peptidase [Nonomuraea pusilla]
MEQVIWLPGDRVCLVGDGVLRLVEGGAARPGIDVGGLPGSPVAGEDGRLEFLDAEAGRCALLDPATGRIEELDRRAAGERARRRPRRIGSGSLAGDPEVAEVLDPGRRLALGVNGPDLSLRDLTDDRVRPLTATGDAEQPWQVEGACWSPDGTRVAALRTDLAGVRRAPVVHWLGPWEEIEWVPFTRSGGPLPQLHPYLVEVATGEARPVDVGTEPDRFVAFLGFRGAALYLITINRARNHLRLLSARPDGTTTTLFEERQETFLPSAFGMALDMVTLLPGSGRFVVRSERSGLARLYLYSADGRTCTPLTDGLDLPVAGVDLDYPEQAPETPEQGVVAVDEARELLYFKAAADERRPYDRHLYRVGLDGTGLCRLTGEDGQHDIAFSPSRCCYLDTHSAIGRARTVSLHAAPSGELISTLAESGTVADTGAQRFTAVAADGRTEIHGLLFLPPDLDETRSYPVIDLIYGGPQETRVPRRPDSARVATALSLSALGFACVIVDGRGTPGRSKAFHDTVYGRFGQHEIPDHVAAVRQAAATRPYLDLDRVGIFGHSWGGYMALRGMVTAPEFYRAGVAAMPVADLDDHLAMAIEPYMGSPRDNPDGYAAASSLRLVDRLRGRLCVIAGTSDVNATFSATVKLIDALVKAGKRYDLVLLPEVDHHPRGPARDYYDAAVRRFFLETLRPEEHEACHGSD